MVVGLTSLFIKPFVYKSCCVSVWFVEDLTKVLFKYCIFHFILFGIRIVTLKSSVSRFRQSAWAAAATGMTALERQQKTPLPRVWFGRCLGFALERELVGVRDLLCGGGGCKDLHLSTVPPTFFCLAPSRRCSPGDCQNGPWTDRQRRLSDRNKMCNASCVLQREPVMEPLPDSLSMWTRFTHIFLVDNSCRVWGNRTLDMFQLQLFTKTWLLFNSGILLTHCGCDIKRSSG